MHKTGRLNIVKWPASGKITGLFYDQPRTFINDCIPIPGDGCYVGLPQIETHFLERTQQIVSLCDILHIARCVYVTKYPLRQEQKSNKLSHCHVCPAGHLLTKKRTEYYRTFIIVNENE